MYEKILAPPKTMEIICNFSTKIIYHKYSTLHPKGAKVKKLSDLASGDNTREI